MSLSPASRTVDEGRQLVRPRSAWWRRVLSTLLVLAALAPLVYWLTTRWAEVKASLAGLRYGPFAGSQALMLAIMPLMAAISWVTVRRLAGHLRPWSVFRFYFISQIPKYLPGGFWAFPGRMVAYAQAGVERSQSVVSVFREVTAVFLGAAAVGLLGLVEGLPMSAGLQWVMAAGVAASVAVIILTQVPWTWRLMASFRVFRSPRLEGWEAAAGNLSLGWVAPAFLVSLAFWLAMGVPFRLLLVAVHPAAGSLSWLQAASVYALAWCVGFVIVFAPAGLGIREATLTYLLLPWMSEGSALSVALLSRLTWMVAEGVWVVVALLARDGTGTA